MANFEGNRKHQASFKDSIDYSRKHLGSFKHQSWFAKNAKWGQKFACVNSRNKRHFLLMIFYLLNLSLSFHSIKGLNNHQHSLTAPTLSRGIIFKSLPNFRKTSPQFWSGLIPTPSIVRIEVVFSSTRNFIRQKLLSHRRIGWQLKRVPLQEQRLL